MSAFCFLDIETTGLDPDRDEILEIAWVFTDAEFNRITSHQFLIEPDWSRFAERVRDNQVVYHMHSQSGLLADLYQDRLSNLDEVSEALLADAAQVPGKPHMAGFSVSFDRDFLRSKGLRSMIERTFHHRLLDLSSMKLFLDTANVSYAKAGNPCPHRAMWDVSESIEQARILRSALAGAAT